MGCAYFLFRGKMLKKAELLITLSSLLCAAKMQHGFSKLKLIKYMEINIFDCQLFLFFQVQEFSNTVKDLLSIFHKPKRDTKMLFEYLFKYRRCDTDFRNQYAFCLKPRQPAFRLGLPYVNENQFLTFDKLRRCMETQYAGIQIFCRPHAT